MEAKDAAVWQLYIGDGIWRGNCPAEAGYCERTGRCTRTELARISHEEHQTEWKNNTILINYTLIYLKFGIADCNSAK